MSARLAGAVLALVAIALLAATFATSALWSGHPSFRGRVQETKTLTVGLWSAEGCKPGGDNSCVDIPMGGLLPTISLVELGASGLLAVVLLGLAITSFTKREGRKAFAKLALGGAALVAVLGGLMIVTGPVFLNASNLTQTIDIKLPLGFGMLLLFGAVLVTLAAGVLAPKQDAPKRLRPSRQPMHHAQPAPQPELDLATMFPAEAPASYAPPSQPTTTSRNHPPVPTFQPPPLPPPQLRPLYDAAPAQGGTGGYVPTRPVTNRPPTTLPTGPLDLRAQTTLEPELPPPPPFTPPLPGARAKAASIISPPRTKAPSLPAAHRGKSASAAPPAFSFPKNGPNGPMTPPLSGTGPSLPGLPPPASKLATGFDALPNTGPFAAPLGPYASVATAGLVAPLPPIVPPSAPSGRLPMPRHSPTTVTPVVPPPGGGAPAPRSPYAMLPVHADPDPGDDLDTRQVDKERPTTAAGLGVGDVVLEPVGEAVGDSTDAMFAPATAVNPKQGARAESDSDLAETRAVEKHEMASLDNEPNAPLAVANPGELDPALVAKLPVTTAPADLAPPKEEKQTAGPQPACPQCEAPMTWVEEHLRFYCKSCRMYF